MDVNKYALKVQNAVALYKYTQNQPSDLDATKRLYYAICDIEREVTGLNKTQVEAAMGELLANISKMKLANTEMKDISIEAYKYAIAYLEYFSNCRLNYFLSGDKQSAEFLFNSIYNASDYPKYFTDSIYNEEQQYYLKNILLGIEAEAIRDHAKQVADVTKLVLYGFNDQIISEHLVSQKYAQIAIAGPLTPAQNESFVFYKFNVKNDRGERYDAKNGVPYDRYAYIQFANNCSAANRLQNYLLDAFKQIMESGQFKGFFYNFAGQDLQDFAKNAIHNFEHQLEEIKGSEIVNASKAPKDVKLETIDFGNQY